MTPIALSPCPNDTFLLWAWIAGKVGKESPPIATFADIESLNAFAYAFTYPLIKLSFYTYARLRAHYQLLDCGATLGYGVGPKLIAKKGALGKRVAIPGRHTTAHFLLNLFFPELKDKRFCLYSEVESLLERGEADYGVIIHESRFTFHLKGLLEIADLGELWQEKTSLPLPLGGFALKNGERIEKYNALFKESLHYAKEHREEALPFVLQHSREKAPELIERYLGLYVNKESEQLTELGKEAIRRFLNEVDSFCDSC